MDMQDIAAQTAAFYLQLIAVLAGTGAVTALLILGAWRLIEAVATRRQEAEAAAAVEQEWLRREHLAANWPFDAGAPE